MLAKVLKTLLVIIMFLSVAILVGCEGETGPAGATGVAGQDGQDGNTNVIMFEYGTQTTSSGYLTYQFEASQGLVDSSLVVAFANPSIEAATAWYPVPGLGSGGTYMTRSFFYQTNPSPSTYTYTTRLLTPDGAATYTTSVTFTKFKILLVPASSITMGKSLGTLDLTDYNSVQKYFNLPD